MNFNGLIIRDPKICGGEPVIKGTRITLRCILSTLAEGADPEKILKDYPSLTKEKLRTVIAFAAASAEEDIPLPEIPRVA